ncbi:MAG: hypothetical protein F6J97_21880 [Leptolyngbya sp. SIO4C1]|nr:hypothetical protein [Leptolyngbya sp. SIO4C1]
MAATGQALMETSRSGAYYLLNQAREQLGLEKLAAPQPTQQVSPAPAQASRPRPTAETVSASKPAETPKAAAEEFAEDPESKAATEKPAKAAAAAESE